MPDGVDAVLRAEDADQVVLVGTEGVGDLKSCIAVLDAPLEQTGPARARIALTPRRADASVLRAAVLGLHRLARRRSRAGSWCWREIRHGSHRALRQVIRAELKEPAAMGLPRP